MSERGKYIVIEGGDGTGKSSQVLRLNAKLNELGIETLVAPNIDSGNLEPIQEPGGTDRANELRRLIKDASIARTPWQNVEWFTEARQSNWNELIEPALQKGIWVPTARSYVSTIAYQGYGGGIDVQRIETYTREQVSERYMRPDFLCILALKNETVRRARITGRSQDHTMDTFESKPEAFQHAMQDGYAQYAEHTGTLVIDASRTEEEVFEDIWRHITPLID